MNASSKNIAILLIPLTLFASTVADEVGANESKRKLCLETPLVGKTVKDLLAMDCLDIWKKSYKSISNRCTLKSVLDGNVPGFETPLSKMEFIASGGKLKCHENSIVETYSDDKNLIHQYITTRDFKGTRTDEIRLSAPLLDTLRASYCVERNPQRNKEYWDAKLGAKSYAINPVYTYCKTIDPYRIEWVKKMGTKYLYELYTLPGEKRRPEFSNLDQIKSDKKRKVAAPNNANNICMKAKDYEGCMKYQGAK